ncbi:MAG: hypothetical protein IJ097_01805 [Bacilli bacterium]|nr:hypothetical protein [Bacilli bacterium]
MSDLVIKNVLDAIHYVLKHNGFEFTDKQIQRVDNEIIPLIKESNDFSDKEFRVKRPGVPILVHDKRINSFLIKYFAIIEGNLSLYNSLMEVNYNFDNNVDGIKFYALDKIMTSNFKKNEFVKLIMKNDEVIGTFYSTLRGLEKSEKEKYCSEFSNIIHIDASTMKVGYDPKGDYNSYNFLIKRNIDYFGSDFLINTNKNQRDIINSLHFHMKMDDADKIKELLIKYPNCHLNIMINSDVLYNFTIDEIVNMSLKDAKLYEVALKSNLVSRIKELLKINPNFDCPSSFISEEIFRVIDNETILGLTDEGILEISKIKIPEIDNVVVMPVKKIKKIVFMDNMRKLKDEKFGFHK